MKDEQATDKTRFLKTWIIFDQKLNHFLVVRLDSEKDQIPLTNWFEGRINKL